jgi:hypothetical protein
VAEQNPLAAELQTLWGSLAVNPRNRALVIARILSHQNNPLLTSLYADHIARHTPPSAERDQALRLLVPPPILPSITILPDPPPASLTHLRTDAELGRLAAALDQAAEFRLWIVGRDITRQAGGSGIITRKGLKARLVASGVAYSARHYRRLLEQGKGVYWHLRGQQVYLRSVVKVACDLTAQAEAQGVPTEGNEPGVQEVYLDVSGTLEQWEARLYAGWIATRSARRDLTIARATEAELFNRHPNTIRRWEQERLAGVVSKRVNFAQCSDVDRYFPYIPEHAQAYVVQLRFRKRLHTEIRLRWQLPNTYSALIAFHPHRGQAAKVRRAVNGGHPAAQKRGGHCPRYLASADHLKRLHRSLKYRLGLLGDVRKPVYVYLGEHLRTRQGMYEVNNSGFVMTHPNERVHPQAENEFWFEQGQRQERWVQSWLVRRGKE